MAETEVMVALVAGPEDGDGQKKTRIAVKLDGKVLEDGFFIDEIMHLVGEFCENEGYSLVFQDLLEELTWHV